MMLNITSHQEMQIKATRVVKIREAEKASVSDEVGHPEPWCVAGGDVKSHTLEESLTISYKIKHILTNHMIPKFHS